MPKPSRMDESNLRNIYSRLIQINQEAFGGGEYDAAYHAPSGTLHCAVSLREINYLGEIERLADQQLRWIDTHDPEYEYSTQSTSKRGVPSIYRNLANMANARAIIIQNEAKQHHD
jgi:hypothetical protein